MEVTFFAAQDLREIFPEERLSHAEAIEVLLEFGPPHGKLRHTKADGAEVWRMSKPWEAYLLVDGGRIIAVGPPHRGRAPSRRTQETRRLWWMPNPEDVLHYNEPRNQAQEWDKRGAVLPEVAAARTLRGELGRTVKQWCAELEALSPGERWPDKRLRGLEAGRRPPTAEELAQLVGIVARYRPAPAKAAKPDSRHGSSRIFGSSQVRERHHEHRLMLGIGRQTIARMLGVTERTVRSWEEGTVPPSGYEAALAAAVQEARLEWLPRRIQARLTQEEAAVEFGRHRVTLSLYEREEARRGLEAFKKIWRTK